MFRICLDFASPENCGHDLFFIIIFMMLKSVNCLVSTGFTIDDLVQFSDPLKILHNIYNKTRQEKRKEKKSKVYTMETNLYK